MKELYVVNCCRTAIGSFGGSLKNTPAVDMGAIVVKEALKRANVAPENVDELMFGCILTAAQGQNPARQVPPRSRCTRGCWAARCRWAATRRARPTSSRSAAGSST